MTFRILEYEYMCENSLKPIDVWITLDGHPLIAISVLAPMVSATEFFLSRWRG